MRIFITGGTGFIGQKLVQQWLVKGHQITILTRNATKTANLFAVSSQLSIIEKLPDTLTADVVVNLAGEPIFHRAWNKSQKERLWQSRVEITQKLVTIINQSEQPPQCFISGSASGYYGDQNEQLITETHPAGNNFTAKLCIAWEQAALQAKIRVCLLRTGLVLAPQGGLLAKILPVYRCGLGGKLGSGQQFMPWIALDDMINAINLLIDHTQLQGAFNLSAPNAVRNAEFNLLLATQLKRPHFATVPTFLLKMLLGERSDLILDSQKMYPQRLLQQGFSFQYKQLADYFATTFANKTKDI